MNTDLKNKILEAALWNVRESQILLNRPDVSATLQLKEVQEILDLSSRLIIILSNTAASLDFEHSSIPKDPYTLPKL